MAAQGFVYLVGAGPGDPKLLTIRALELMRTVDVIAHDELVPAAILSMIPATVEAFSVGRRHGRGELPYRLHPEVLDHARAGRTVMRLKCGDPSIFGRGGEEAEDLAAAGIPFEIVPGVSAAVGAAACAAIPLTDRRYSSRVTFMTGHYARGGENSQRGTVVLFMAAHGLEQNLKRLISEGYTPLTPAAYIASATRPEQQIIAGTLSDLARKVAASGVGAPALVIAGEVVALRERIQQFAVSFHDGRTAKRRRARVRADVVSPNALRSACDCEGEE